MIKILLVTHFYPKHRGGVEIAAQNIAKQLSQSNQIEIIWCAADCDDTPDIAPNLSFNPLKSSNIIEKLLPFPYPLISPKSIFKLWNLVKSTDIVHLHDFIYFSNTITFIFAKIFNKKILITQHIGFIKYKSRIFRLLLSLVNKTIGNFILSKSDFTIFISRSVMNYFSAISFNTSNFHFIPNSTDTDLYCVYDLELRDCIRQKYKLKNFTFLFVGRFTEKKGLPLIEKLAIEFPKCDFLLAGWGAIDPNEWNIANVRVLDGLQGKEVADLYNIADALLLPSYGEGFPLVVQEALACGLDLVISQEIVESFSEISSLAPVVYKPDSSLDNFYNDIRIFIEKYEYSFQERNKKAHFANNFWSQSKMRNSYLSYICRQCNLLNT